MRKYLSLIIALIICSAVFAAPLSEGFEGLSFPPDGWKVHNGGGTYTWYRSTEHSPHTGEAHAQIYCERYAHDDWLISPQLLPSVANHTFSFWSKNFHDVFDEEFNVKLSTGTNNVEDFTVTLAANVVPPGTYTQYTYDLSAYIGTPVYVAVQAISQYVLSLYVDDVTGPEVIIPSLPPNVAVQPMPMDNAIMVPLNSSLTWLSGGGWADSFDLYFGTTNPPPFVGNQTGTSYNPGNMQAGTDYYWQVVPRNTHGETPNAPVWKFSTIPSDGSVKTIGTGTTQNRFPLGCSSGYEYTAALYRADELGPGNRRINMLAWYTEEVTTIPVPTRIYLKPYYEQTVPIDTWENVKAGATLVYDAIHNGTLLNDWTKFILDTPFDLDNGSGLLVMVERSFGDEGNGTTYSPRVNHTSIADVHRSWTSNDNPPTGEGSRQTTRPNLRVYATPFESTVVPAPATLVAPENGATDMNQYATLSWGSGGGGPTGYKLYLGTNPNPPFLQDLGNVTSWNSPMLQGSSTYYWKIVPYNNVGDAQDCPVWSFETVPAGVVYIGNGSSTSVLPISPRYGYSYTQSIFLKEDIRMEDQSIEKVAYYWNGGVNATNSNDWVIYMGHTNNSTFTSTTNWLAFSQLTQVFSGYVELPAVPGWIEIELDTPFAYNNARNLVIAVDENTPDYDDSDGYFLSTVTTGVNRSLRYLNDNNNPNPASPPTGVRVAAYPNLKLTFGVTAEDPVFALAPDALNFGEVTQFTPTSWQNATISNSGGGTINIVSSDVTIVGPHADMFHLNRANLPAAIASGNIINLPIRVIATEEGALSATLQVLYQGETYSVELSATGLPYGQLTLGTGRVNRHLPVSPYWGYSYTQTIYPQAEINMQDMRIEKLAYHWNGVNNGNGSDQWVVYMAHTDRSTFDGVEDWLPLSELTEVYRGTLSIPAEEGWIQFDLDTPFIYNNTQNLVIAVDENSAGYSDDLDHFFYSTATSGQVRSLRAYSVFYNPDPADLSPTNILKAAVEAYPNTRFRFADLPNEPTLQYNAELIDFGTVFQNEATDWKNLRLTNIGVGTLQLYASNFIFSGDNAEMFELDTSVLPLALSSGSSGELPIRLTATSGGRLSATLQIHYSGEIYEIALTAEAMPGQMVIIGDGELRQRFPLGSFYGYERSAAIYSNEELDGNVTEITNLGWYGETAVNVNVPTKIYLKSVFDSTLQNGSWANMISGATLVYDRVHSATTENSWNILDLDQNFVVTPEAGLLVLVERNYGGTGNGDSMGSYIRSTALANVHLTWNQDNSVPTGDGSVSNMRPNLALFFTDPVSGPPAAVRLNSPANGAIGMPLEGFELSWTPNLAQGGIPEYYGVFMSHDEADIFGEEFFETENMSFNPVAEGGLSFQHNERWYWAVEAVNADGSEVSDVYRFDIIAEPPQIAVIPTSLSETLEVGESSIQNINISNPGQLPLQYSIRFSEDELRRNYVADIHQITPNPDAALFAEQAPNSSRESYAQDRAYMDLQFIYADGDGNGEYGVASDGEYIYTSKWNGTGSQRFFKYALNGEYLGFFDIAGFSGVRDFTYDGRYFYGANATNTVYVMDFANQSLVRTITVPVAARGIAYDRDRDGLWITNNFSAPLRLVNLDGEQIQSLATSATSLTGLAYDAFSGNGSIWANTQTGEYANDLVQIDASSGAVLSTLNVNPALLPGLSSESLSGGIEIASGIVPGYATIMAKVQNEMIYGMELCTVANWAYAQPSSGEVAAGESATVAVNFNTTGIGAGEYTGNLQITHNAPADPVNIPLSLTVTGEWTPIFNIDIESWDFAENEVMNPNAKEITIKNTGGPYLELDAADLYISGDLEGNFTLETENLPIALDYNETYKFKVVFAPQSIGEKTATLYVQDGLGRELHAISLSGSGIEEAIGEVINLQADVQNGNEVQLSWGLISGEAGTPGWLHYDDGTNHDGIGTGGVANFDVAIKFTGTELWNYSGMQLERIRFFPVSGNTTYALKIWTGADASLAPSTLLYTQPIASVNANAWNEIQLDTPFPLVQGQALWIGYNCDVQSGSAMHPAGCDAGPAVVGKGDVIALGGTWYSMKNQYGLDYNWNLQAYVNEASGILSAGQWLNEPVSSRSLGKEELRGLTLSTSGNPQMAQRVLRGFNVFRNGVQLNSTLVPSPTYLDLGVPNGIHSYTVQGVYYSQLTPMSDPLEVEITAAAPHALPFYEDFSSEDLETNFWSAGSANWGISTVGNPAPGLQFAWNPQVQNYEIPFSSYSIDATGIQNVELSFAIALDNYSTSAANYMFWEVFDGTDWITLGGYSSLNGSFGWRYLAYDISEYVADSVFKIRFLAIGEDSYEINHWFIDNIRVSEPIANLEPISDLAISITGVNLNLDWSPVPNADWYWIYTADSPTGDFNSLGYVLNAGDLTLPLSMFGEQRSFIKITAGAGSFPRAPRLDAEIFSKQ